MSDSASTAQEPRRDAIDVARVLALGLVVVGHLLLAVIDRVDGAVRGANLLALHPGWAVLAAAAPMPVFFAAGGYANATATLGDSARRLRLLAGLASVVVVAWSIAVAIAVLTTGRSGIVGDGARLATQPLWFVAAYAPFAASGRWLSERAASRPIVSIGGCLVVLAGLDLVRFAVDGPEWIGWIGFAPAWVVPWLAGGWWRHRVEQGSFDEHRLGTVLAVAFALGAVVLVHGFGYSAALIDAVPGARSNTTPPTLYTATVGLAQVGVLMLGARALDRLGRRWRRTWTRAGEAAVGVYVWHLTALSLCAAVVAAGFPMPRRLTASWWVTRPLWWATVLGVALAFVIGTDRVRRRIRPSAERGDGSRSRLRSATGVAILAAAGAAVGLKGPRSLPLAMVWSALFVAAWWLLRVRPAEGRP
ncbi:MAG TPA: acyltransferase [Ilumatobacteraceae bacterium]|nr:acyltransferase [Ilumatobacteraceae bacterium]